MEKIISKQTLLEVARLCRKYAETGDLDILQKEFDFCDTLSEQAFGDNRVWLSFKNFIAALCGLDPLMDDCTDDQLCAFFRLMGFKLDEEINAQ